ncbi:MAG: YceI family protein [Pseudomonadota bacterium]
MKKAFAAPLAAAFAAVSLSITPVAADDHSVDPSAAVSGVYASDPGHAYITFSYLHQGYSRPFLRWRSWNAELDWNAENPEQSKVTVDIDATSIDSGVDDFDDHLRAADFFNVEKHPKITFVSTGLETTGESTGVMTGDLTVKGVTKPVSLDVTLNRAADDDFAEGYKLGFSAKGAIKRSDFDVGKYAPFIGDDVDLIIEVEFVKPKG